MKKHILTILVITLLFTPFITRALPPIFVDDGGSGDSGSGSGGGNTGSGTGGVPVGVFSKSDLFVDTIRADGITQSTATLYGDGGYKTSGSDLPLITAYFRYAKAKNNPPIFCNDIYGSNMKATEDIFLKKITSSTLSQSFSQQITNLSSNTTYYYCAIISNKDTIAYGGSKIVKEFHTNCYDTTVETKSPATNIRSTSASLAGTYCSPKNNFDKTITNTNVTTYFEYKKATVPGGAPSVFATVPGSEKPYSMGNNANLYGNINTNLLNLAPDTKYQFRAVVKNNAGTENETIHYGLSKEFTTIPGSGGGSSSQCTGTSCLTIPPTCTFPYVLNESKTVCINSNPQTGCLPGSACFINNPNPPTPTFCQTNPTDPSCSSTTGGTNCMPGSACYNNPNPNDGTWTSSDGGSTGTWGTGTGSGTWRATSGIGGTGIVTWVGTGNGTGTWRSSSGSGTWTNNTGTGGAGTGTWTNLVLGQNATPPDLAIVRYHEGIETVFAKQIVANQALAQNYGYKSGTDLQNFAWYLADEFAKAFGYIDQNGKEIRVSFPDVAAYQLQLVGNKLTVYEYYANKIVDIRNTTATFKNKSDYEYYFKK